MGLETPRGLLLSGPPGCGKARLARRIAEQCEARFLMCRGIDILDRFHQDSVAPLSQAFDDARLGAPSILYIDDIELLAPMGIFEHGRAKSSISSIYRIDGAPSLASSKACESGATLS